MLLQCERDLARSTVTKRRRNRPSVLSTAINLYQLALATNELLTSASTRHFHFFHFDRSSRNIIDSSSSGSDSSSNTSDDSSSTNKCVNSPFPFLPFR